MKRRWTLLFEASLAVLFLVGAVLVGRLSVERSALISEYERLKRVAGELPISDPTRVYIQAVETGEPWHSAWRIYEPPGYTQTLKIQGGSAGLPLGTTSSESQGSQTREFIARVRITFGPEGLIEVFYDFGAGQGKLSQKSPELQRWIQGHESEIRFDQAGKTLNVLKPNQQVVLLRLILPELSESLIREWKLPVPPANLPADQKNVFLQLLFGKSDPESTGETNGIAPNPR